MDLTFKKEIILSTLDTLSFETAQVLATIGMAKNRLEALREFERNLMRLSDWRIVYADSGSSMLQTKRSKFSSGGCASSLFRGTALWIFDVETIAKRQSSTFLCGAGNYLDSNAASIIRSIAYNDNPRPEVLMKGKILGDFLGSDMRTNPYLYLWESQRHWNDRTIQGCRETFAAVHALGFESGVPDLEWGRRFRAEQRIEAERIADIFLSDFQTELDKGLADGINEQVAMVEAMLVRTKIIEYSSRKSPQNKLHELIDFMHNDLATIMTRELIVCADILCSGGKSRFSQKLNGVRNGRDPFALLRNCAWDLFLPRALDMLAGAKPVEGMDFYLPHIITFDEDVAGILRLTELRSVALHRPSGSIFPFFNFDLTAWMSEHVGSKRGRTLEVLFEKDAYNERAKRRSRSSIVETLNSDRQRLQELLHR